MPLTLLPYLSALLWWFAYPPLDLGWLAWVALAPWWLYVIEARSTRAAVVHSTLAMALFCLIGFSWLRFPTWAGWIAVSIILSMYGTIFALVTRWWVRPRHGAMILALPMIWVGTEHLRSWLWTGFPWFHLAHTQHDRLWVIQGADTVGPFGLSLLVAIGSGVVTYGWVWMRHRSEMPEGGRILAVALLGWGALAGGAVGYGAWVMPRIEAATRPGPLVGIVQGNIPQSVRAVANAGQAEIDALYEKHRRMTLRLAAADPRPSLIFWPEAMYPYALGRWRANEIGLADTAREARTDLCVGTVTEEPTGGAGDPWRIYNSAYQFSSEGVFVARYDKIHLVPVGEYIPMRDYFPQLPQLIVKCSDLEEPPDQAAGTRQDLFDCDGEKFGVLICFESLFPELSRAWVTGGAKFLAHLSNDGWFEDSAELPQIEAITQLRAVECRVGVVRATNTGISSFISPTGAIRRLTVGERYQNMEGTMTGHVPIGPGGSRFVAWGDRVGVILCALVLGSLFAGTVRAGLEWRKKRKSP